MLLGPERGTGRARVRCSGREPMSLARLVRCGFLVDGGRRQTGDLFPAEGSRHPHPLVAAEQIVARTSRESVTSQAHDLRSGGTRHRPAFPGYQFGMPFRSREPTAFATLTGSRCHTFTAQEKPWTASCGGSEVSG
jgi:hypothetical protein